MIKLTLGTRPITSIAQSSGFFMGEKNTMKTFRSEKEINEIVGDLSGKANTAISNEWVKGHPNWEEG